MEKRRYKIAKVKCYGEVTPVLQILRLRAGWKDHKQAFWRAFQRGYGTDNFEREDASEGSIALFGVLKVMDEVAMPLYKTVVVLYTEDEPLFVSPEGLMENTVRMKKTSVLLHTPEADFDWQDAWEPDKPKVTAAGDSDEDDNIF